MRGFRGGGGRGIGTSPPHDKHKVIGFFSNTGLDLMENHKAIKRAFNVGPTSACQQNAI